jgi:hypothetical protein
MDQSFVQSYGKSRRNSRFTLLARNRPLAALEEVLSREILEILREKPSSVPAPAPENRPPGTLGGSFGT